MAAVFLAFPLDLSHLRLHCGILSGWRNADNPHAANRLPYSGDMFPPTASPQAVKRSAQIPEEFYPSTGHLVLTPTNTARLLEIHTVWMHQHQISAVGPLGAVQWFWPHQRDGSVFRNLCRTSSRLSLWLGSGLSATQATGRKIARSLQAKSDPVRARLQSVVTFLQHS